MRKYRRGIALILSMVMFFCSGIVGVCAEEQTVNTQKEMETWENVDAQLEIEAQEQEVYNSQLETEIQATEIVINPLYEEVIDEAAVVAELEAIANANETVSEEGENGEVVAQQYFAPTYTSYQNVVAYVKSQLLARNNTISFAYTGSSYPDVYAVMNDAMAHREGAPGEEGDSLAFGYSGWRCQREQSGTTRTYEYTIVYNSNAAQEVALTTRVDAVLKSLNLSNLTDAQKIRKIHDYICDNVSYDYEHLSDSSYRLQFTAYAALVNGTAVCQGYAILFYRMCMDAGIDVRVIPGVGNGGPHAWNIVEIDNKYYNLDATWDDQESYILYDYYLKSNSEFYDHTREAEYTTATFNSQYPMASTSYDTFDFSKLMINKSSIAVGNISRLYYAVNEIATVSVAVYDGKNALVKTVVPSTLMGTEDQELAWDLTDANGDYVESGTYRYTITAVDLDGKKIVIHKYFTVTGNDPFAYKWTTLNASNVTVGNKSNLYYAVNRPATITIAVYDGNGSYLKTLVLNRSVATNDQVVAWDLTDASGDYVDSGTYRYTITAVDAKGKKVVAHKYFTVKGNVPFAYKWTKLNADRVAIGSKSNLYYATNRPATVTIALYDGKNAYLKTLVSNKSVGTNDQVAVWDLTDAKGNYVTNGTYRYTITAVDAKGNKTVAHKYFTVTGNEPLAYKWTTLNADRVAIGKKSNLYYAVNRPATVTIAVYDGKDSYLKTLVSNKSIGANDQVVAWDLKDAKGKYVSNGTYRYTITAVDAKGNKVVSHKWFKVTGN